MNTILLSDANVNTIISGLLVLAGVGAAPLIAFFTTWFNRMHDEHKHNVGLLKPIIEDIIHYSVDTIQKLNFLYSECNGKTLDQVIDNANLRAKQSEFPLGFIQSIELDIEKLSNHQISGITVLPTKILKYFLQYSQTLEIYIALVKDLIMNSGGIIDLSIHNNKKNSMYKSLKKLTINIRKFLGVR